MYESTQDAIWVHGIDLAQEADFDLGSLRVHPATCIVVGNGASRTLQRRVMQVLVVLAQARGAVVSQTDLVGRCWRGLSVSDDAIYRCISKLRKLAADYPDAPYAIEAIPGVGYRLTPSGIASDRAPADQPPSGARRIRLRSLAVAAALGAAMLMAAIGWIHQRPVPEPRLPVRVTVQPFGSLSDSEDARSLARRIPDEVVNELGDNQIETVLGGTAQTSSPAALTSSAASGLVVTGLLRDEAPNLIVAVRVEDGASHAALWSAEFKRDRREASDLPREVAAQVADTVNMAAFARSATPPLNDDSALSALLQVTGMIRDAHGGDWAPMIDRAQDVVASHPQFAFGHSILASSYAEAADSIGLPDRARAMSDAARREANLTLKLDPEDAGAYAVLHDLEPTYNFREREAILLRGIQQARHPKEPLGALYSYEGRLLENVGRLHEALSYQLVAQATDRWGPPKTAKLALIYANVGNLPAAKELLQTAVERWPNHSSVRAARLYIPGFYEPPSDARAVYDRVDAQIPQAESHTSVWRSFVEAKAARSARVTRSAVQTIRDAADRDQLSRENEIMMLAGLGETKQAIDAANRALDHQELQPRFLFTTVTRKLRQDPAFIGLASRMGLVRYWHETGKGPDFCTDPTRRSECSPQLLAALRR